MGNGNRNMTIEATNILFFFLVLVIKMKIAILHKLSETKQNAKKILAFKFFFLYLLRIFIYLDFFCTICVYHFSHNVFIICFI